MTNPFDTTAALAAHQRQVAGRAVRPLDERTRIAPGALVRIRDDARPAELRGLEGRVMHRREMDPVGLLRVHVFGRRQHALMWPRELRLIAEFADDGR